MEDHAPRTAESSAILISMTLRGDRYIFVLKREKSKKLIRHVISSIASETVLGGSSPRPIDISSDREDSSSTSSQQNSQAWKMRYLAQPTLFLHRFLLDKAQISMSISFSQFILRFAPLLLPSVSEREASDQDDGCYTLAGRASWPPCVLTALCSPGQNIMLRIQFLLYKDCSLNAAELFLSVSLRTSRIGHEAALSHDNQVALIGVRVEHRWSSQARWVSSS
ncbi:hypothetical protein RRG08_040778 [Elysia crispata]|uniref:Uncharacterized protein n=1 Tax=Elysia crispata TaxID=231223 RepID=A0AAE1EE78_9GAST|nr:hypothetical protein RRG08_040778 [Elysia crispata]